jgi:murein L,D-transpeptidase YafK
MKTLKRFCLFMLITGSQLCCMTRISVDRKAYFTNKREQPVGAVRIVIDKSDYLLRVYDEKGWFASYPVVFGNKSLADKKYQGDRNTPEGIFRIVEKRRHEKWHSFLLLDYPNKESWEKFNHRKSKGIIPANANIGGEIGIHGTLPHFNGVVDAYTNWTEGCISLKNYDLEELYRIVTVGTIVKIRK